MIERIKDPALFLNQGLETDFFGCRVIALKNAYGLEQPFAEFWIQHPDTFVARLDQSVVLRSGSKADWDELSVFLPAIGAYSVLGDISASALGFPLLAEGVIMARKTETYSSRMKYEVNSSPRELYGLLRMCRTDTFQVPDFEGFYLDLSHRTRHGVAVSVAIRDQEGKLAACAFSTVQSSALAVISGVAVRPDCRRRGFGAEAVRILQGHLQAPEVCVYRAQGENEAFYQALGFQNKTSFFEWKI